MTKSTAQDLTPSEALALAKYDRISVRKAHGKVRRLALVLGTAQVGQWVIVDYALVKVQYSTAGDETISGRNHVAVVGQDSVVLA